MGEAYQLIYEVTVSLAPSAKQTVLSFMRETHIAQVIAHPAFSQAEFFEEQAQDPGAERFSFTTHYYIQDMDRFQDYLENSAPALREDFMRRFGQYQPAFSRRILQKSSPQSPI